MAGATRPLPALSRIARLKASLLIAAVVVGFTLPQFLPSWQINLLSLILIMGLFAMSVDLLGGYTGLVSMGHAGILGVAAYGVGYVSARLAGPHSQQIVVGLLAGMAVTFIFGIMAMRTTEIYFIMVTLAQGMVVWGLAFRLSPITGGDSGLRAVLRPEAVSAYWQWYYLVLSVLLACSALLFIVVRSPFGLVLKGIREGEGRMNMLGYNTTFYKLYVFMVAGFFASVAGVLFAYHDQFVSPAVSGILMSAGAVLAMILGGAGTLVGPLIGATVVATFQNVVSQFTLFWGSLLGFVFIGVIIFARKGLIGALSVWWERKEAGRSTQVQ